MEDIAAEADVGKGTLYRYFEDKEELYLALLSRAADQVQKRLEDLMQTEREPVAQLEAVTALILDFFEEQPHIFELIQQAEASRGTNHPWQAARDVVIEEVIGIFADAEHRGQFVVHDPMVTALVLLGGVRAVIRFGPKPRNAELARQIVDVVLGGAAKKQ